MLGFKKGGMIPECFRAKALACAELLNEEVDLRLSIEKERDQLRTENADLKRRLRIAEEALDSATESLKGAMTIYTYDVLMSRGEMFRHFKLEYNKAHATLSAIRGEGGECKKCGVKPDGLGWCKCPGVPA